MKTSRHFLITILFIGLLPACSRVDSVSRYGVRATLVDGTSGQALREHRVRLKVDRSDFDQTTTRLGKISAPSVKSSHWTWLGGPMYNTRDDARIEIHCPGYQPRTFTWGRYSSPIQFSERRGTIDLGEVKLQPR